MAARFPHDDDTWSDNDEPQDSEFKTVHMKYTTDKDPNPRFLFKEVNSLHLKSTKHMRFRESLDF